MTPKVAVCYILKADTKEVEYFSKSVESIKGHVNGVFVNLNSTGKISKTLLSKVEGIVNIVGGEVITSKWEGNFVKSRNDNFAQVPKEYDFIAWFDADDTIRNPEKIREVAAVVPKNVDGVYINYEYAHDDYGNVTVSHYVARLVRNNGTFTWKSSFNDANTTVHETLNPIRNVNKVMNEEFVVVHNTTEERRDESLRRNITLLEGMLEESSENPDPRILYYLATHYIDAGLIDRAKELFEHYLKLSGWAEERSQAWSYLGDIYNARKDSAAARSCYLRAIAENPKDPIPLVELAELEMGGQLWDKAVEWLTMATQKKVDKTVTILRPLEATYRAYKDLAEAYTNLGAKHYQDASKWLKKAIEMRPFDPELQQAREYLDNLIEVKELNEATLLLVNTLKKDKEEHVILPLMGNLPSKMQDSPLIGAVRNYYNIPVVWPKKSVAIVCGWGPLGNWGPNSLEKGLGGSEEAVIRISKELAKLGYKVTIFGTPGNETGTKDGVEWRHYWEFNRKDTFDILINWRNPGFFDEPVKARKSYLWLHDVMDKEEMTEERIKNVDRIIFVSQYHRNLYPFIPEEKCFVSGNGISPEDFEKLDGKLERDPHRCVYMSSHVRGLELVYKIWPDVKKAVPDAKLDVYYGWESYIAVNKDNPERMAWKQKMEKYEHELDGVTDHGRIGHDQINEEIFKAGVWVYPCPFPEVYPVHGDSLIECLDGKHKIKDLLGKKNFKVYSCNKDGDLDISTVKNVFLTRKNTKMLRVGFKSGVGCKANEIKYLTLTPDHEVMMRDGSYCAAENLEIGDSVKAFHRHKNGHGKGYDHIGVTDRAVVAEHRFVAEKAYGQIPDGYHVDHLDSDTTNNKPENLEIKTNSQHWLDTWNRKDRKEKRVWTKNQREGIKNNWTEEEWSELRSKAAKKAWQKRKGILSNHKVVSVDDAPDADAYCMEVEPDHNFVANGIFVHNCITAVKAQAGGAVPVASDFAALKETVQFGSIVPIQARDEKTPIGDWDDKELDDFRDKLIDMLKHPEKQEAIRQDMMQWARTQSWENTAKGWDNDFAL